MWTRRAASRTAVGPQASTFHSITALVMFAIPFGNVTQRPTSSCLERRLMIQRCCIGKEHPNSALLHWKEPLEEPSRRPVVSLGMLTGVIRFDLLTV